MDLTKYKVDIPEGESGEYRIERFVIDDKGKEHHNLLESIHNSRRNVPSGSFTRLMKGRSNWNGPIMSDTPAEVLDHLEPIRKAKGKILITGLGIGMVLDACLKKESVEHATVIEFSEDVIKLVAPHYQERYGDRLEIIHADALEWKSPRGSKYGMVWHDIWPNICADNWEDMKALKRRYARKSQWVGCWAWDLVQNAYRRYN